MVTKVDVTEVTNEKMKQILTAYAHGYKSPKEIARITGINYNTVKVYLKRARQRGLIKHISDIDIAEKRLLYLIRIVDEKYAQTVVTGRRDRFLEELLSELEYILRIVRAIKRYIEYVD